MLRVIDSFLFEGDDDDNNDDDSDDNNDDYCRDDDDDVGGDDSVCSDDDDDNDDDGNKLLLHQYPFYYHLSSLNKDHLYHLNSHILSLFYTPQRLYHYHLYIGVKVLFRYGLAIIQAYKIGKMIMI